MCAEFMWACLCVGARDECGRREWLKANSDADLKEIEDKKSDLETAELAAGKTFEEISENTSSNRSVKRLD